MNETFKLKLSGDDQKSELLNQLVKLSNKIEHVQKKPEAVKELNKLYDQRRDITYKLQKLKFLKIEYKVPTFC